MLSYISSSSSLRSYPLHILQMRNNNILTTIPQSDNESIFFEKNSIHVISHHSDDFLFKFKVCFKNFRTINKTIYYSFELIEIIELDNVRKENRQSVQFPASFIYKDSENPNLGLIVDISDSGMKLETTRPIESNKIHIMYDDTEKKQFKIARVMWNTQIGDKFYYGLKALINF